MVVGSQGSPSDLKNPWDAETRMDLVRQAMPLVEKTSHRFRCVGIKDYPGDDKSWVEGILAAIRPHVEGAIHLAGMKKDPATEAYLRYFDWPLLDEGLPKLSINATDIRKSYFSGDHDKEWAPLVPFHVADFLRSFRNSIQYTKLANQLVLECKS